ncbi:MAG: site-2 protease family protein [Candidatus Taylorbacteria bacterium]|nr:site-2 protease family protein [Candidatus Taylorbacteria bacterium]
MLTIISFIILIISVILHELSHGYMADFLGDPTARHQGRLTLNPLKHIELWGSIIVPIFTSMAGFTFGWAKPVPFNPYNLKNKRQGEFLIAAVGPLSNIGIALIFGILIRVIIANVGIEHLSTGLVSAIVVFKVIIIINIMLAIFNLIPMPPLDGSKLLLSLMPNQYGKTRMFLERYALVFLLIVVLFIWQIIEPIIPWLFRMVAGIDY